MIDGPQFHNAELIGFINAPYQANENDGFVTVEFGVLNGVQPSTDVTVELSLSGGTARSKFYMQCYVREVIMMTNF